MPTFPYKKSPKLQPIHPFQTSSGNTPFSNEVTYLGVTIDKYLLFHEHFEKACSKTHKMLGKSLAIVFQKIIAFNFQ